jgi:hypothetical protein
LTWIMEEVGMPHSITDDKQRLLLRIAIGFALAIIVLGIVLIILDFLDIAEGYRLQWNIAVINTVFISAVAMITVCFATKNYLNTGSPELFGLGGAVLAFGFSIVLYGWLTGTDLNTRITVYDSGVLVAAVVHFLGAVSGLVKPGAVKYQTGKGKILLFVVYTGVLLVITLLTWLAHQDIVAFLLRSLADGIVARDVVQGIAAVFCLGAVLIYLRKYLGSRCGFYLWYSLGLILFAAGVIFISRGVLESRIAWLGRVSQYVAGGYFLVAAVAGHRSK